MNHETLLAKLSDMVLVSATIKPFKLKDVENALEGLGYVSLDTFDVEAVTIGAQYERLFGGRSYPVNSLLSTHLEVVVKDEDATNVFNAIVDAASTGEPNSGRVGILPVEMHTEIS